MFASVFSRMAAFAAVLTAGALCAQSAMADVKLPKVFGSNMVLQQGMPVNVWGWAGPGESVKVSFGDASAETKATEKGEWKLSLPAQDASAKPAKLTVEGKNKIVFENVLVGEVWLCSGQSNMQMGVTVSDGAEKELASCENPNIRLFHVKTKFAPIPQTDVDSAGWLLCNSENLAKAAPWGGFSAAGYYFGKDLNKALNVPVGLIASNWGGTRIEPWTSPEGFAQVPSLNDIYKKVLTSDFRTSMHKERIDKLIDDMTVWIAAAQKARDSEAVVPPFPAFPAEFVPPAQGQQQTPCWLYNAMLHGLIPFQMRGAIWYQGESNHGEGKLYVDKTKALVASWRQLWGNPAMPYYLVQIAPYQYGSENPFTTAEFWEAQYEITKAIPNTGIVGTTDIANLKDIHPKNKAEVGRRLALQALAKTYGKKDIESDGPAFKSFSVEGSKVRVAFDNVPTGLKSNDGKPLDWFEIIDAEKGGFVAAKAEIDGKAVVLSAEGVDKPVAIRFAWSKLAEPNLVSSEGLPAYPFRAGDVPKRDPLVNIPGTSDLELIYELDLGKLGANIVYDVDNSAKFKGAFDKIAYYLELGSKDGGKYIFVSTDAFTDDLKKIGVPTVASKANFQQLLKSMDVYSNVPGIVCGTGIKTGNIEFWPNNYGAPNAKNIPNASPAVYDFGDQFSDPVAGYGSMQIHNYGAKQTLFAINHWVTGQNADLGIGNRPGAPATDWTFAANAKSYEVKSLKVFVSPKR